MMKGHYLFFITLLHLLTTASFAQSIDVEKEKYPGTKKLVVKSFNGCCAQKGYKAVYLFDSIGRTIKSYNYFKRKLLAAYGYRYNEQGLLSEKISVYQSNKKSRYDNNKIIYKFDTMGRVINKTTQHGNRVHIILYGNFDSLNNPKLVVNILNNNTIVETRNYNANGQLIQIQTSENDTMTQLEEIKYNVLGDITYSNIPTLQDKETGKMVMILGGNRHWYVEEYVYTYDKLNRWTEKYVLFDNKKVLLERRIYR